MYASYEDYCGIYGGACLTQEQFAAVAAGAGGYMEALTYGRCAGTLDQRTAVAVKKACCAMAEELHRQQATPALQSQSVGQWSRSYAPEKDREKRLADAARRWLRGTGLLWRGWRYVE